MPAIKIPDLQQARWTDRLGLDLLVDMHRALGWPQQRRGPLGGFSDCETALVVLAGADCGSPAGRMGDCSILTQTEGMKPSRSLDAQRPGQTVAVSVAWPGHAQHLWINGLKTQSKP